jgi:hypothetical protein
MSRKPSPSKLRLRAERRAKRLLDPIVQAKALEWAKRRESEK